MRSHALIIALLLFVLPQLVNAQRTLRPKWEYGGWIGLANYNGDLNTTRSFQYARPAFGATARYNFNEYMAIRPFLNFGVIEGTDIGSRRPFEQARRLDFRSNILEAGGQFEFNFFKYDPRDERYYFAPYTFVGLSVFYFDPKGSHEELADQPLQFYGTEGQGLQDYGRTKYSLVQPAVPFGIGIKYSINYFWNFAIEVGQHKTFTDYIDDVSTTYVDNNLLARERGDDAAYLADKSGNIETTPIGIDGKQRGNSQNNDSFMFIGVYLTRTIRDVYCTPRWK